jgi:flagellar biosynthesis/type III secretory pathway chaperone
MSPDLPITRVKGAENMQTDVEKLEEILGEELSLFDKLVQACSEATTRILRGDLDGLADVTRRQNELVMSTAEVAKARLAFQRGMSNSEPERPGEAGAEPAVRFIAEPYASRLAEHDDKLGSIAETLRERSEYNRFLLACSLQMVDRAMQTVCDAPETDGTYSSAGSCSDRTTSNSGLLNKKI